MLRKSLAACLVLFATAAGSLQAQNIFALPGTLSTAQSAQVYSANPLSPITGITTGPGAFLVLPAAGKFYIIQTSTAVGVTDGSFATTKSIGSFSQVPTGAVVTPDGKRLAVAAATLHFFDTSTDTELISSGGVSMGAGISATNVTVSLDGKTFYAVGVKSGGGSVLESVDAATLSVTGTLTISGTVTFVAVGRNGLIYVGTQTPNQLIEVNPSTLAVTSGGTIPLGSAPSVIAFTPDGQYALINNKNSSGALISNISLSSHSQVSQIPFASIGVPIDSLQIVGANAAAAFASATQSLYQVQIGLAGSLTLIAFPGLASGVTAIATSNEVTGGTIPGPASLFASGAGTLYRLDIASGGQSQTALPITTAALSFAAQAVTGTQPTTLIQYGSGQTVNPGGTSLPIVVQALDGAGRPISGVTVTFSATPNTAVVSPTSATTGSNGYAVAYVTAPSTAGTVQVTAAAGVKTSTFTLTVASTPTGSASGLKITAGQGQLLPEGTSTANAAFGGGGSSLIVLVTDSSGNPVNGSPVSFTITQGPGGILSGGVISTAATVNTDATGHAFVDFSAPILGAQLAATGGFVQTTIVAANGTNNGTFYITTSPAPGSSVGQPTVRLVKPDPGSTLTGQVGAIITGAVQVQITSFNGVAIPNVGLTLTNGGLDPTIFPSASCNDPAGVGVFSDSTGVATCDVVLGPKIGSGSISVNVGYSSSTNPFNIVVTVGPPAKVNIIQGNNQSGTPGQTLPLALLVQVTDAGGNPLAGVPVSWQVVTAGTVTLKNVISTTDANARASALATPGNTAGAQQVKVTAGTATATFTINVNIAAAGLQKVSGDNQNAVISSAFASPLVVKVVDAQGAPVAGAQVTFSVTAGSATVASPTATTGADGQASTGVTAGTSAGAITITATTAGLSATFNLTSRLPGPSQIVIYNGPDFAAGFAIKDISPGSIATITGLGIATGVQGLVAANNIIGPLPTTLAGVSVTFNGTAAPIYYVLNSGGKEQVTVQVPFEVQPGDNVSVVINGAGGGSTTVTTAVKALAPGAFTTTYGTQTIAVAQRVSDGTYISPTNPAHPGDSIRFYVTGLGQVTPATTTGAGGVPGQRVVAQLAVAIQTSTGAPASATGAQLVSAEYAPGLAGVYAVTVRIPTDTATGTAQLFAMIAYDSQGNGYFLQSAQIPIQ